LVYFLVKMSTRQRSFSKKDLIKTLSLSPRNSPSNNNTQNTEEQIVEKTLEKKLSIGLISPRNLLSKSQSFYNPKILKPLNFKILLGGDDNTGKTRQEKKIFFLTQKQFSFEFLGP
jgi:hypothetical protein